MRTGLVVLGTVIAALGAGLILVLFVLSGGPSTSSQFSFADPSLAGHTNQSWVLSGSASSGGSVIVSWTTSAPANVSLWPMTSCSQPSGSCPIGPAVLRWTLAVSGRGSVPSTNASGYVLQVTNPGGGALSFSASVSVSASSGTAFPMWTLGVIVSSGVTLLIIGGIALFLGLFLPAGIYRDPEREARAVRQPGLPPRDVESSGEPDEPPSP